LILAGREMRFEQIKDEYEEEFRRLTGIKRRTFEVILTILGEAEAVLKAQGGKPNKLALEDRLLMTLEYLREYRTYFHISRSYGISESACYRNIRWIEDILIKDKRFSLPGRKALLKNNSEYELVLIDATETPIERPKKNRGTIIREKRGAIL
jgi:Helix-turn-helix of DDE superfamily endonuclease